MAVNIGTSNAAPPLQPGLPSAGKPTGSTRSLVLIDGQNRILAGNARLEAARAWG
jgi:hypothetical protein